MTNELTNPDYLFEVSWEVCNKVGGIYTVIATKSLYLKRQLHKHHILIGPDVWMDTESNPDFIEDPHLYSIWKAQAASEGIRVRIGKWNVPGNPIAILVDFKQFLTSQNDILSKYWERFQVDSITGNWDYKENFLFGYAAGKVIESFRNFNLSASDKIVAQFHEWQTGAGLLYLKYKLPSDRDRVHDPRHCCGTLHRWQQPASVRFDESLRRRPEGPPIQRDSPSLS